MLPLSSTPERLAKEAPDELGVQCGLLSPDRSTRSPGHRRCHCGDLDRRSRHSIRPSTGTPLFDAIGPRFYVDQNRQIDESFPPARCRTTGSPPSSPTCPTSRPDADRPVRTVPLTDHVLRPRIDGRPPARVASTATAYPHREPGHNLLSQPMGRPRRHGAEHRMDPRDIRSPSTPHGQPSLRQLPLRRRRRLHPRRLRLQLRATCRTETPGTTPTTSSTSTRTSTRSARQRTTRHRAGAGTQCDP